MKVDDGAVVVEGEDGDRSGLYEGRGSSIDTRTGPHTEGEQPQSRPRWHNSVPRQPCYYTTYCISLTGRGHAHRTDLQQVANDVLYGVKVYIQKHLRMYYQQSIRPISASDRVSQFATTQPQFLNHANPCFTLSSYQVQ